MKLYTLLGVFLLLCQTWANPCILRGRGLRRRANVLLGTGGLLGRSRSEQYASATGTPAPVVNVNVRNVYSNQNNNVVEHNNNIARAENTLVNNNANYNQEINNRVSNKAYTDNQVSNVVENNGYY